MLKHSIFSKFKWQYLAVLTFGLLAGIYISLHWPATPAAGKLVTLKSRGLVFQVVTRSPDVAGVFSEQSIPLQDTAVEFGDDAKLYSGMTITYRMPVRVTLVDGGKESLVSSNSGTVEEFLKAAAVTLAPKDEISPGLSAGLYEGMAVEITRVEEVEETRPEPVAFSTEYRNDPESLYGAEIEVNRGQDGEREVKYLVRYKNGLEASRKKLSSQIIRAPVSRVVRQGRKIVVESAETGRASWYAYRGCLCAAHPYFSKGSLLRVTDAVSGKSVIVTVNDRGPDQRVHPGRVIDLDSLAFKQLASLGAGTIEVKVEKLKTE